MSVLDMFRLDDRVAIVTGASSGLGVSFARAFAEAGADVVLDRRPHRGGFWLSASNGREHPATMR